MKMASTISTLTAFVVILISLDSRSFAEENHGGLLSQSSNAVASKLYNTLAKKDSKNIFISPLSLNYALAALSVGTEGKSYDELSTAMSVPKNTDAVKMAYKDFTNTLEDDHSMTIATKLYIDSEFQVKESYQKDIAEYFSSAVGRSDFKNQPESARQEINQWVETSTNNKIKDMFQEGSIDSATVAVLVNAVHFKSDWVHPFDKKLTQPGTFYGLDKQFEIPMMTVTSVFDYKRDATFEADVISLPYRSNYTMLLLVPHEKNGIINLERKLGESNSNASLSSSPDMLMNGLSRRRIQLTMPKFSLEVTTDMKEVLQQIGVNSIFTSGGLTKISDRHDVRVDKVVQKAYLNVDEISTEAAAATGVGISLFSMPERPLELKVDHPFIFQIVHERMKLCVFSGRFVTDQK